jgi:hypothetical protein
MADIYIGIDPGKTGAIAVLKFNELDRPELLDCPMLGKAIDSLGIVALFEHYLQWATPPRIFVAIEKAQVMPLKLVNKQSQGSVSMFKYGVAYGIYLGIINSFKIPFMEIHPQTWKKEFGLINQPKEASVVVAKQLFPLIQNKIYLKKHHGRCEALLIAEFARRRVP